MNCGFSTVGALQIRITLGAPRDNLEKVRRLLSAEEPVAGSLLVLPELWATGFDYANLTALTSQTPELLEEFQRLAAAHTIYLAGTFAEDSGQARPWNTLYVVGPEGVVARQRKQHLFPHWQEDHHFLPGRRNTPMVTPGGLLGGLICYDLRFPELARELVYDGCSLLVVTAQWPATRLDHWQTLLRARAIENQVYVVAANSSGLTGAMTMAGHSMVLGPDGGCLAGLATEEGLCQFPLVNNYLDDIRARFCSMGERPWQCSDVEKVIEITALEEQLRISRHPGSRLVFTNGCFDILHPGHVSYLEEARRCGDYLVVGLNSDASVRRLKGSGRPVNSETERARVLAALGAVDRVVIFAEDTPLELINRLRPDVLVKGADWPEEEIVGAKEVKGWGGQVERIHFAHQSSTSGVIERIRELP
ncbi:MAG: D-glycero-beta-D-manno-heptose 1-phosphate adenylyltransferase [Desulfobulbus propionicus]|nr:MAG: D-glycero-beta-D-manno-heptose 1-phosphate adenylyltransferase [Desulfobulbus propionicus]